MSGIAVQCLEAWTGISEDHSPAGLLSPSTSVLTFGSSKRGTSGARADFCLIVRPTPTAKRPRSQGLNERASDSLAGFNNPVGTFEPSWGKTCHVTKQLAGYVMAGLLVQGYRVSGAYLSCSLLQHIQPWGLWCSSQIFWFASLAGFSFFDEVTTSVDRLKQNRVKGDQKL